MGCNCENKQKKLAYRLAQNYANTNKITVYLVKCNCGTYDFLLNFDENYNLEATIQPEIYEKDQKTGRFKRKNI